MEKNSQTQGTPALSVLPPAGAQALTAIARLRGLAEEKGYSLSQIAEAACCSKGKVSQIMNGKYADSESQAAAILERLRQGNFITRAQETITAIFDLCMEDQDLGVVVGPSGLGKTYTATRYAESHDQVMIYTPTELSTPTGVLQGLAQALGLSVAGNLHVALSEVQAAMARSYKLLIVDECDVLARSGQWESTKQKFAIFRQIMEAGVGVCLIGIFPLEEAILGMPGYFQNRIGYFRKFKTLSKEDLARFVDFFLQEPGASAMDRELKALACEKAYIRGGFHYLSKLLKKGRVMGYKEVMSIIFSIVR